MKIIYHFIWVTAFFLATTTGGTLHGQSVQKGKAEAFSKMSMSAIISNDSSFRALHSENFKKPNPERYTPSFVVDPNDITDIDVVESATQNMLQLISPLPDTTFDALYDSGNSIPPDVNGAPGPNHLMVTLNTEVRIQDRDGTPLTTISLGAFWTSLPGSGTFDPKIVYDFQEDRWLFSTCAGSEPGNSRLYIGVSANSDPMGDWFLYSFITDNANQVWFDYPSMGFNDKWVVISGNMFGNAFYRTVFTFDKQSMYAGQPDPSYTRFTTTQGFTLVPATTYDVDEPNVYLVSAANGNQGGNGYITLFKVSGAVDDPQFSLVGQIGTNQTWAGSSDGSGDFLPQLGSNERINSVDHRIENVIFRNGKIWAVHHIFLPANNPQRTAVQWWNITPEGSIIQRGRVDDPTNVMSYAFATIAVNQFEDMIIGHGIFSANQYAAAGYSYRAANDAPNTIRMPYQYKDGLAPYYKTFGGGRNRWGDYTATMLDPVNSVDFWVIQQYAELPSGGDRWGTWWAYLRIPFAPQANFVANETLIPLGENIQFTDLSIGVPQSWQWSFEGGTPAGSSLQNPTGITYSNAGSFDVSLTVTNDFGSHTYLMEDYITVSATLLPSVEFLTNKSIVCTGETVTFTDQTLYMPHQWEWVFTPSTVTFVNGTDAFSQNPEVVFDEANTYSVTLTATNLNGNAQATKFDFVRAGGMQVPLVERFDVNGFAANNWTVTNPDNQKTWEIADVNGLTETQVAAKLDFINYFAIGQRDRLVSSPLDLRDFSNMMLGFKHAHARRIPQISDSLIVLISDDCGSSWTRLFADAENGSGNFGTHPMTDSFVPQIREDWCGAGWGAPCIQLDLSAWAGKSDVLLAFESYSGYGNPMYLTDIEISTTVGVSDNMLNSNNLSVIPNPARNAIRLQQMGVNEFESVQIYNASGKLMIEMKDFNAQNDINIRRLSAGIYYLKAQAGRQSYQSKFVVE